MVSGSDLERPRTTYSLSFDDPASSRAAARSLRHHAGGDPCACPLFDFRHPVRSSYSRSPSRRFLPSFRKENSWPEGMILMGWPDGDLALLSIAVVPSPWN